jgi:hypothetical protein
MFNSSEGHYETAARKRNSYRSLIEKLLGKNKATESELQRDEADQLNSLVDQRVENDNGWISHQEAADEIVEQSSEFYTDYEGMDALSPNERLAIIGEYVVQETPRVSQYVDEGNFTAAAREFASHLHMVGYDPESEVSGLDEKEMSQLQADFFEGYFKVKLESAMAANDNESLYEFIDRVSVRDIPPEHAEQYVDLFQGYFEQQNDTSALGPLESLKERIAERKIELEEIEQFVAEAHTGDSETV